MYKQNSLSCTVMIGERYFKDVILFMPTFSFY